MLTTKYTWLYRGFGALGCGLVLLGIFLPWATISAGGIGPFGPGDTPTGWDLAYSQKSLGSSVNIAGAVFIAVFMLLLFAVIGMIVMVAGRDGASFSYFLISTSVFFLLFMLILLPYAQQSIPLPSGPSGDSGGLPGGLNNTTSMVQQWKDLKLNPLGGFYLSFAGSIVAYVASRMIVADTSRITNYRKFSAMLAQAHKDGKVTTDEEALLAKEREILKISRDEQIYIIRQTVPDPALQERLIQMHDKPVDIEQILRTREFDTYKKGLVHAYGSGTIGPEASEMLALMREGLSISDRDHDAMLNELVHGGQVVIAGSMGKARLEDVPPAAAPPSAAVPPPVPLPYEPSPPPAPAASKPAPVPSALSSTWPAPSQSPAQPVPPASTSIPPPEEPSPPMPIPALYNPPQQQTQPPQQPQTQSLLSGPVEPARKVKCTRCGELIPITTDERPIQLICPRCGFSGMLRK
jgi:DNA-directed RNA polymerase subunit RPC12/RpoP